MKTLTFLSLAMVGVALTASACRESPLAPDGELTTRVPVATSASVAEEFSATEMPIAVLDPGVLKVQNNRIIATGIRVKARVESSDSRFTGFMTAEMNSSFSPEGEGPVWAKFIHEVDGGGVWEGVWRAHRSHTAEGIWTGAATWTAQGHGGGVNGMKAWGTETITTFSVIPAFYIGEIQGYIAQRP